MQAFGSRVGSLRSQFAICIIRRSTHTQFKFMEEVTMTNAAAIGYALIAAKKMGMSHEELKRFEAIMYGYLDLVSEDEAEEIYRKN
jgi:hypothetical protein